MTSQNPSKRDPLDWDLIDRYLAGELDEAASVSVRRSLMAHGQEARILGIVNQKLYGDSRLGASTREEAQASWAMVSEKIGKLEKSGTRVETVAGVDRPVTDTVEDTVPAPVTDTVPPNTIYVRTSQTPSTIARKSLLSFPSSWLRTASYVFVGTVVAVIAVASMSRYTSQSGDDEQVFAATTYTTPKGQQSKITLPDGSTVILNVASRLQIPTNFAQGNRQVVLEGAAMFSVVPNAKKPFTVVAHDVTTRVLGTTFGVRRYETDSAVTVAVRDGKVAVGSVIVSAQQQVVIDGRNAPVVSVARPSQFTFTDGVLTFEGIALKDAVADLNRWYNADIRIMNSTLAESRIRATFPVGSLTDLANMLEFMFDAVAVRQGQILTLYRR